MPIDADHLAEVAEESVDLYIIELLLRHILDIDGEAPGVVDHIGLLLGFAT